MIYKLNEGIFIYVQSDIRYEKESLAKYFYKFLNISQKCSPHWSKAELQVMKKR